MARNILLALIAFLLLLSASCTEKITPEIKTMIGNRPAETVDILRGLQWSRAFVIENPDQDVRYNWQAIFVARKPQGEFGIDSNGVFLFATALADSGRDFHFRIILGDGATIIDDFDFTIRVRTDEPLVLQISRSFRSAQGVLQSVRISKISGTQPLGRIDCAIAYDSNYLELREVQIGRSINLESCTWDRFEFSTSVIEDADSSIASVIYFTAIADDPLIETASPCLQLRDGATICEMFFLIKDDHPLDCEFLPVRFIWTGCRSNAAYSPGGDSVFVAGNVFDFDRDGNSLDITGADCNLNRGYSLGGECPNFLHDCETKSEFRTAAFFNGGVYLICSDSIGTVYGMPGDVDCSGIISISDAVLFIEYLKHGETVIPAGKLSCARGASDANLDGLSFTVAEPFFIVGYVFAGLRHEDLHPFRDQATLHLNGGLVEITSDVMISGVQAFFNLNGDYEVVPISDLYSGNSMISGKLSVLLMYDARRLYPGSNALFRIEGDVQLDHIDVSDPEGNLLRVTVEEVD